MTPEMWSWITVTVTDMSEIAEVRQAEGGPLSKTTRLDAAEFGGDGGGSTVIAQGSLVRAVLLVKACNLGRVVDVGRPI